MDYAMDRPLAIAASGSERAAFIRRTYAHLAGAILALIGLEAILLQTLPGDQIVRLMLGTRISWLVVIVMFMGVSWLANSWAHSNTSVGVQYLGLGLYVAAWSILLLPILKVAMAVDAGIVGMAAIMTLAVFGGLTLSVFTTRKDFSYLGPILSVGGMVSLGLVVALCLFPATQFVYLAICFGLVALVSASILYSTSNVMLHYRTSQHVAAALALFAGIATLFYYILQIFILSRD